MGASAKILNTEKLSPTEGWTIVMPCRGKKTRSFNKILILEQQREEKPWAPIDLKCRLVIRNSRTLIFSVLSWTKCKILTCWLSFLSVGSRNEDADGDLWY
ncbi:protein SENSITIVITY TO RED LIGHT REDUCED 1-like [Forsythia ovata]|uniref:Protein SENSITIVITY TO RED LIGHT REDUCED 1-like n=1 Tax=Forsythia ovata TaxID=205694 RepID=A0ABD1U5J2_9LAMI